MRELEVEIEGMHCASCPLLVDDCVEDIEGVLESRTDLRTGKARIKLEDRVSEDSILGAISQAGYTGRVL